MRIESNGRCNISRRYDSKFNCSCTFINSEGGGTKGITQEYRTKSGAVHTAKKSREQHIV